VLDQFELSNEDLDNLTGKFHTDLIESLSKESHASPLNIQISSLTDNSNLSCNQITSIVLSWRATCISLYQVTNNGNNFDSQPLEKVMLLPSDVKTLDGLVDKLSQYIDEAVKVANTSSVVLVHDFIASDDERLTISCINGPNSWKLEGDSNANIISLLRNSLQAKV